VILQCNYEELRALKQGARVFLGAGEEAGACAVAAPPEERARVEALLPRLDGDVGIPTLAEQIALEEAVDAIVVCLRSEMEAHVVATHPADEVAVAAYFDFAHALAVLGRLRQIGSEMRALIEVVTGAPADERVATAFRFPD
jgi:hypothetical protein